MRGQYVCNIRSNIHAPGMMYLGVDMTKVVMAALLKDATLSPT
jgi:hypothetical protein